MGQYILAIDQGTTGSRCFIFNSKGKILSSAYQEFPQYFPKPGWVEHDASQIWTSVESVVRKAIASSKINPKEIKAIGITNQRETTLLWDRLTHRPVSRAIVWQDRRTSQVCSKLKKHETMIRKTTGLVMDPYFSATKIAWILDHTKGLRKKAQNGDIAFGTMDSWLIYKLTGGQSHVTDMTNASRTLIYDIVLKQWSDPLLKLFSVPQQILPRVLPSGSEFGQTIGIAGLPSGIPILAVMGDQQAALYGQGCHRAGTIKNTYGTGCFMVLNTGNKLRVSKKGLLTTLAADINGQPVYALEGSVFIAGAVIQWLRDQLQVIPDSASSQKMIHGLKDSAGVYFVPAFTGLGAPYWNADARGIITGLTRGANVKHIIRAALESIAYQTKDVFNLMQEESGLKIKSLAVDGGACRNSFLMQFQADLLSASIVRPVMVDSTVAGVAYLAGIRAGLWTKKDLSRLHQVEHVFKPQRSNVEVQKLYGGWQKAVRQAQAL
ncbi:MAG: glycerol kinase GlpK [Candidatus Omnitrophica bacterium]|nr:glycerol kinase GlpK [Candidatus Omnitrophota bacterium]